MNIIGSIVIIVFSVIVVNGDRFESDQNEVIRTQFKHRFDVERKPVIERRNYQQPDQDYSGEKYFRPRNRLRSFYKQEKPRYARYSVFQSSR